MPFLKNHPNDLISKWFVFLEKWCGSECLSWKKMRGILPDYMHLVHLACGIDAVTSVILDVVDHPSGLVHGNSRDKQLETLWCNYKNWAEASRRLTFYLINISNLSCLRPGWHPKRWPIDTNVSGNYRLKLFMVDFSICTRLFVCLFVCLFLFCLFLFCL